MRNFDHEGLLLAEYQAKLFEKSCDLACSSAIFIRRFKYSNLLKILDENNTSLLSLDINDGIDQLIEQFGEFNYGKNKFSKSSLFWMGYLYRYISYTRECKTSFVMQLFNYELLNNVYYTFHTQDIEWCIANLLSLIKEDESIFDKNIRLKKIIKEKSQKLICSNYTNKL